MPQFGAGLVVSAVLYNILLTFLHVSVFSIQIEGHKDTALNNMHSRVIAPLTVPWMITTQSSTHNHIVAQLLTLKNRAFYALNELMCTCKEHHHAEMSISYNKSAEQEPQRKIWRIFTPVAYLTSANVVQTGPGFQLNCCCQRHRESCGSTQQQHSSKEGHYAEDGTRAKNRWRLVALGAVPTAHYRETKGSTKIYISK